MTALADQQWLLPGAVVASVLATELLWWFTARRPSLAARVIVMGFAILFGLGIAANLLAIVTGRAASMPGAIVSIVSSALYIAAVALLFRPDARAWFGDENVEGRPS